MRSFGPVCRIMNLFALISNRNMYFSFKFNTFYNSYKAQNYRGYMPCGCLDYNIG